MMSAVEFAIPFWRFNFVWRLMLSQVPIRLGEVVALRRYLPAKPQYHLTFISKSNNQDRCDTGCGVGFGRVEGTADLKREEKKIMVLCTGAHSLVHLFEGVLPPLIPLVMLEFGTDYFTMGLIVSVFSYAFGLGALPSGILADKVGPRRLVTLYLFGAGCAAILILPIGSLWLYGLLMGVIGAFCSTYHPAANTLISNAIRERGNAFGVHGIAGSLGVAIVPALSAWLGTMLGWRAPHVIYGLIGIGVGIYSLTLPRYKIQPQSTAATTGGNPQKSNRGVSLNLILFFSSTAFLGLTYKGIMTFLPTYMGQKVTISFMELDVVAIGGAFATIALISGAVGQYAAGRLVDRFQAEKLYFGAVVLGTLFVFVMAQATNMMLVAAAVMYAFFYFATQPIQNFLVAKYVPEHRRGLGYGILFVLTFGVGSTAAAVAGYLADQYGLEMVFYAMGLCFLVSSGITLVLAVRARKTI
jgi:MFS family permease